MKISDFTEKYLPEFVYGGTDGIVTTFAVVSAVAGAGLEAGVVLILGFANLISDGISMGISAFLSEQSDSEQYRKQRRSVVRMLEQNIDKAQSTIADSLRKYGLKNDELDSVAKHIARSDNAAEFILKEEHELAQQPQDAKNVGLVTFLAFITFGIVPLIAYLLDEIFDLQLGDPFVYTMILAAFAFALIGWLRSQVAHSPALKSIIQTLILGAVASGASFYIGRWLETLVS